MATYGQFFNPKKPDNRKVVAFLAMLTFILLAWIFGGILSGCNTVKKSTDIKISEVDSSWYQKADSSVSEKKETREGSNSKTEWDNELTVKFNNGVIRTFRASNLLLHGKGPFVLDLNDTSRVVELSGINELNYRSKGKDSTIMHKADKSTKESAIKKEQAIELSKFDKSKSSQKETSRTSPVIWVVLGFVAIIVAGIFIIKRFR